MFSYNHCNSSAFCNVPSKTSINTQRNSFLAYHLFSGSGASQKPHSAEVAFANVPSSINLPTIYHRSRMSSSCHLPKTWHTHTVHTKHHNEPHIQQQTLLHTLYNSHSHIISVCQAIFFECMQLYWPWPKNTHTLAGATTQRTVVHRRSPLCTSMRCKQARAKWLAARLECTNSIVGASLDKDQQHMMSSMRYYILPTFECKTTPHVFISLFWATTAQYMGEQGMESEPWKTTETVEMWMGEEWRECKMVLANNKPNGHGHGIEWESKMSAANGRIQRAHLLRMAGSVWLMGTCGMWVCMGNENIKKYPLFAIATPTHTYEP